jgi:heavy metal sensor kinase
VSLRVRLALGYAILFIIALALLEVALYVVLQRALLNEADKELHDRAAQVERAVIVRGDDELNSTNLSTDIFVLAPASASQELTAPGIHIRILDRNGTSLASSSRIATQMPVDTSAISRALGGENVYRTVIVDGTQVRALYHPLRVNGSTPAVIQVVESLNPTVSTLQEFRTLLLIGGVIALLGGLAGAWSLTRQALRPVVDLTDRVAGIAATGEFGERVPEPATQDEIGRLAHTFNDLIDRIHLMFDRQRTLVADTSHELRNPLMVVRGNLELLAHDLPPEERREATRDAIEEVDRMTHLVQDLLFLADAEAEEAIEQDDVPLEAIVAAVVEDAEAITTREDGTRELVLEANDPLTVRGDAERLRQLIWNLVENAIRYTPAGGTVTVSLRRRGPVAELTVSDTGIGIPPEHLAHIFERFYRVDTGRSRALGGTGLGLSIVRQIAAAHGGQVRVRSTPGEGSTFTVALPVVGDE